MDALDERVPKRTLPAPGEGPLPELDTLFTLAEISIGMAGFSAIVVLFKRRDSGAWLPADADRFNGMVAHAMAGAFFCVLPAIIHAFTDAATTVWQIASSALGIQILGHTLAVARLPSTRGIDRSVVVAGGLAAVILQALNVLGLGFSREFPPYLAGVLWHALQAGTLFVMLIWVRPSEIERR